MTFKLMELPYSKEALEPNISAETLHFHYDKHHKGYVEKLNELVDKTALAGQSLHQLVLTAKNEVYNNAAQVWNHDFYWHCLAPNAGGEPKGGLNTIISNSFGSFDRFKDAFTKASLNHFGSGWTWLVKDHENRLKVISTKDAANPLTMDLKPVLTCDVWEHAYYIDHRNERKNYLENFWKVVNWSFVEDRLTNVLVK